MYKNYYSPEEAKQLAAELGLEHGRIDLQQFCMGLNMELQHESLDPETDISNGDRTLTAKLVVSYLQEIPDYYTRLGRMLQVAEAEYKDVIFQMQRGELRA